MGVGAAPIQWRGRRSSWKPAGWWGPPAAGSLERAGYELCWAWESGVGGQLGHMVPVALQGATPPSWPETRCHSCWPVAGCGQVRCALLLDSL